MLLSNAVMFLFYTFGYLILINVYVGRNIVLNAWKGKHMTILANAIQVVV